MSLKDKIQQNLKSALKEKKELEATTLRMLSAQILNKEKEKRTRLAKEEEGLNEKELAEKSQLTDDETIEAVGQYLE